MDINKNILQGFESFAAEQQEINPLCDIYLSLSKGEISYREYLHKLNNVVNYMIDDLGFVINNSLQSAITTKLQNEALSNNTITSVANFVSSASTLKSIEDDYI